MFKLIVCVDENFGIGKNNDMPWGRSIKSDLNFFKEKTLNQNVLMGYNTYTSIIYSLGKPLPKRNNFVLTSKTNLISDFDHVFFINDYSDIPNDSFIIGGGSIYKYFIENNLVSEVLLTKVHHSFECDTFFPNISENADWILFSESFHEKDNNNAFNHSFLHFKKRVF